MAEMRQRIPKGVFISTDSAQRSVGAACLRAGETGVIAAGKQEGTRDYRGDRGPLQ